MLVAMVAIFAGCWMPLNIVHLIMEFKKQFTDSEYFINVFFIAHVCAMYVDQKKIINEKFKFNIFSLFQV